MNLHDQGCELIIHSLFSSGVKRSVSSCCSVGPSVPQTLAWWRSSVPEKGSGLAFAGCPAKAPLAGSPAVGVAAGGPAPQATWPRVAGTSGAVLLPRRQAKARESPLPRRRTKEGQDPRPPQSGGSTRAKPIVWRQPLIGQKKKKKPALSRSREVSRQGAAEL